MATLIATADGNLTTAATWGTVDATSLLDSEANNTALTTAYVESQSFTPGAITINGIAVKVATRASSPGANTISVRLAQGGATVAGTEVTINVSDLSSRDGEQGWYFFKFSAPVLLLAATLYTVSAKTSAVSMVNLYRNATAGNWSRMLRTTTTAAPAAADNMFILGEWTAAATKTDRTVTMDSTAATDYGGASTTVIGFGIGKGGTLTFGATAATNYILRLSAILGVWHGGTLNIGTTGTPIPRDSTARIEFDSAVDGDFGLKCWGTFNAQGLSRSSGKNVVRCLLNTDEAAAQTVLGVDTDTGWLSGDDIAIASTSRTATEAETRTLAANAGASSVQVTAGLTNAHSGTSPTQAEVILLTRNVRVVAVTAGQTAYVYLGPAAVVDWDWVEFRYLGTTTTGKRGIEIDIGTAAAGSLAMSYCACRDFDNNGIYFAAADHDNWAIDNLTSYLVGYASSTQGAINVQVTTGSAWSISNADIIMGSSSQGPGLLLGSVRGTLTNIRCNSSGGNGITLSVSGTTTLGVINNTWSGFDLHSCAVSGLDVNGLQYGKMSNVNIWRCNSGTTGSGLFVNTFVGRFIIETGNIFGNNLSNIRLATGTGWRELLLRSVNINGDTSFSTTDGMTFGTANQCGRYIFENCDFSTVSGIKTAHTNDVDLEANLNHMVELIFRNTKLGAATEVANTASLKRGFISRQRSDQTTNTHSAAFPHGTVAYETTTFRTASPAEKLSPTSASAGYKLESGVKRVPIASGTTVSVSVYVRKSSTYDGNTPRLVLRANPSLGIDTDQVLATHSAAVDTWQQLSGTSATAEEDGVLEVLVDCDGTTGAVYIDDWQAA
jgi:hypothetical protein